MAHQLMGCLVGTATVIGCGLIGGHLGGDRAGLAAMAVAALYPGLWVTDGGIMSEGLFALLTTAVTVGAYHYCRTRSVRAAIILGTTIGLAVLTRETAALLLIVLAVPLVLTGPVIGIGLRLVRLVAIFVAAGVVVSPWVIRNLVTFDRTVIISTANGGLLGANCPSAYHGSGIGLWYESCYAPINVPANADESVGNADAQYAGLTYLRRHLTRLPVVVAARVGRTWEVYQPLVDTNNNRDDGRPHWAVLLCLWSYFIVGSLAAVGMVLLIRMRRNVLPLVAQIAAVTITAATAWGSVRFRAPVEPVLAVLAAITLSSIVPRRGRQMPNTESWASTIQAHGPEATP
jgi:4-amino-4-deoxy-L-arabinose transferase-like glycosyltransferase